MRLRMGGMLPLAKGSGATTGPRAMADSVLNLDALRSATGYTRQADVERCLRKQGVRYFYGRNGIWTTIDALNAALGVATAAANDGSYSPEEI